MISNSTNAPDRSHLARSAQARSSSSSFVKPMHLLILPALFAAATFSAPVPARADPPRATPGDRVAVEACLNLVRENAEKQAQGAVEDDALGPAGRLVGAAKEAATQYESCIGAVTIPCQQVPGGSSTMGMIECNRREWAVWDERLNRIYNDARRDASPKLVRALRKTQRAWLQWREERCKLPAIDHEGGSIVGPLYTGCMLDATGRQALWLEHRG
jgi:uncharacterized protein YecT (DUF1311 family)